MPHAHVEAAFSSDPFAPDDSPIVSPLVREQLQDLVGGMRGGAAGAPERALMQAMLQDAVLCLLHEAAPMSERPQLAAEARAWIQSRSRDWVFAFESVCEALGIEPDYARRRLLALADAHTAAPSAGGACALRSLRKGGGRRRKAIHFMVTRRRRRPEGEDC